MAEMKNLKVEVVRYNPEVDTAPHSAFYDVPYDEQTSLLDALGYIKDNLAPDLSYRWSCRMAICGSCGMMVNKVPKLACKTFLRDYTKGIKVENDNDKSRRMRYGTAQISAVTAMAEGPNK